MSDLRLGKSKFKSDLKFGKSKSKSQQVENGSQKIAEKRQKQPVKTSKIAG